jgi:methylated-DNA-[protein]-cysteine S-methyltransferase
MHATFIQDFVATPVGAMRIVVDDRERLRALDWENHEDRMHKLLRLHYGAGKGDGADAVQLRRGAAPQRVRRALEAYLDGELDAIDGLEVETAGTPFQRAVWAELRRIPVGTTLSYGALAARIGNPKAVRAVGLANGANPIGVVVPCHRVIGADGSLTGFGGGLPRKRWLLQHEGVLVDRQLDLVAVARSDSAR